MRKALIALVTTFTLLLSTAIGVSPATAAPKSPITLTAKGTTVVPFGSHGFHWGRNQQGAFIAQWTVETAAHRWQIWEGDFNPYEGKLLNQTMVYELPAGTTFLSPPVLTNNINTFAVVYSTRWETETELKSEVEVITLGADGFSEHQVVTKFPTISILKSSDDYLNGCQISSLPCGYGKVAIGGDGTFQTTIAVHEYTGASARIGLVSSIYLRTAADNWTDVQWLNAGPHYNFDSESAFVPDGGDGAFFVYIDESDESRPKFVRISISSGMSVTMTVSNPATIGETKYVSSIKVTRLSQNRSAVTFVSEFARNLTLWRTDLDGQFDVAGYPVVIFSSPSRQLAGSGYRVNRMSDFSIEVLIKSIDTRIEDNWRVDRATSNVMDPDGDSQTILKGNDINVSPVFGSSYTSQNNGYVMAVGTLKSNGTLGSSSLYRSDFGFVPVPVKTKGGLVVEQTLMHDDFNDLSFNVNAVVVGNEEKLEITKVQVKATPKLFLFSHTYPAQAVGVGLAFTLTEWSTLSFKTGNATLWLRCTKRITATVAGIPKFCKPITGQTENSYVIQGIDVGKYLTVAVSATNRWGKGTFVIPSTKAVK